ncbi:MAG: ASKHA domain-containing protein [Chloroflexota bacterium]
MVYTIGPAGQLVLLPSGRRGAVPLGSDLLEAARSLGVELESICGGRQTCGKCQVIVEEGHFPKHGLTSTLAHLTEPDGRELAYWSKNGSVARPPAGRRLACAAHVLGDLLITIPEESQARKQIIAKAATERVIDVQPAVRQVYVEVRPAALHDNVGDWERLQAALAEQWDLTNLSIDPIILPTLQPALITHHSSLITQNLPLTITLWQDREVIRVQPGYAEGVYGLAVDIGSTTIVAHLCDLRTGAVLATQATVNPQVRYGEDLMSRVSYAMMEPQGVARLHRAVIGALNELAQKAAAEANLTPQDILELVVVGNPVMHHLFLDIDPVELGGAPFALAVSSPLDLKARDLGLKLHPAARVHVLPCIAGHVGADNVAVQLVEAIHQQEDLMLVIDVGTNAEIVLGNRERVLCASSPTGPAFEGAQITHGQRAAPGAIERVRIDPLTLEPRFKVIGCEEWIEPGPAASVLATGICGSGIIEAIAELYLVGLIGADGRFNVAQAAGLPQAAGLRYNGRAAHYVLAGANQTTSGRPIVITQADVRAIQLAKAALYAGVKLLMAHLGVSQVERIVLAGAFGSFISPLHAMILGLIPDCDLGRVIAVGNAAGDGARLALLNRGQRLEAARLARWVEHVQTATEPTFQDEFVAAMAIPHAADPFPHLEGILPRPAAGPSLRPSQRRQRGRGLGD